MALISSVLLVGLAHAAAPAPAADLVAHDRLLAAFDTHFRPERVETPVHLDHDHGRLGGAAVLAETGDGYSCLTGLVLELREHWHLFSAQERREMTAILAPWKQDLLDGFDSVVDGAPPPPAGPCFGDQYDNVVEGEHFSVQWEDGAITESKAAAFLDSLEESYQIEIEEEGWREPAGINRYPMLIMVPKGNYAGAYTTVDQCQGQVLPYVVAYSGSFSQGSWYKIMACHEFNHASQFSYGWAHEFWWWEATATYEEENVYSTFNDWANFVYVYGQTPHVGMNAWQGNGNDQDLFYHTYSMAIWGFYLDEYYGGLDAVQETWELAYDRANQTQGYDYWMPDVVEDMDIDWGEAWTGFMAANAVMAYAEQDDYPEARRTEDVDTLPGSGDEKSSLEPQSLGMAYVTFDKDLGESGKSLQVTLDAQDGPRWHAVLVRGRDEIAEIVRFELDDNGDGVAVIPMEGDAPVHLVVSPQDDDAQGYRYDWEDPDEYGFDWEAELIDGAGGGDDGEDGDDADSEDESGWSVCACSAGPAGVPLSAAFLSLVVVARRRRRD